MRNLRFKKPSPALVIAVIALFIGLSGAAYAGNKIGTNGIKGKAVTTGKLSGKAVTKGKLAGKSVATGKLADQAVTELKLGDQSVTESKLGDGSVTNSKLGDQSVTESKLGDGSVTKGKLADEAVGAAKLGTIVPRTANVTIQTGATGSATASCQPGEKIISGGYQTPNTTANIWLQQEDVRIANSWRASGFLIQGPPITMTVTAYCLQA
jgi:hypothetical protein